MPDSKNRLMRTVMAGLIGLMLGVGMSVSAAAQELGQPRGSAEIDYSGFLVLAAEAAELREQRLITLADFNRMAREPNTIILDTRSAEAFEQGHIQGALSLPFSDFTDDKLAKIIPSKDTRILIYCNNNFVDNVEPVPLKRVELALNIPTFINLYGYGYEEIFELGVLTETTHPDVKWVGRSGVAPAAG